MNNSYFSSSMNDYCFDYSSPSTTTTYFYSPILPPPPCPVHSPHIFYTSTSSLSPMNISPISYTYYQQPQVYSPPPVQQQATILSGADRTPLRRHRCFKKSELQILHQAYIRDPRPSTAVLQQLAIQLKAPIEKVRQWFKNRRHSDKQKKRETSTATSSTTT